MLNETLTDVSRRAGAKTPARPGNKVQQENRIEQADDSADRSHLPPGFNAETWAREACQKSGVPFGIEDPLTLRRLAVLTRNPVTP